MATRDRIAQESLAQSEERFQLMVEAVKDYAIFMLDPTGHVVSWNEGAERIKGYASDEIIGRHFSIFYPRESVETGWPDRELEIAASEGRVEDEGWRLRKDGSRFWSNVIITALRDRQGKLVGFTKVTRDMTDRRRIETLELSERRMSEFLAMLSHELRNPLAPIQNAVSVMCARELHDPDLARARDVIDRQVRHLTRLVDDLLEVNRITTGNIRIKRQPVALTVVVERALEASKPFIKQRKHELEVRQAGEQLYVNGDETRLTQVINNLLNNAAKYTPEGGHIGLFVEKDEESAVIRVSDDGVGIPFDQLSRVFDLFRQGKRTLDRSDGGLGVGLTLARELVSRHNGTVEAFSEGAGRGSEFVVRLPLIKPPDSAEGNARSAARSQGRTDTKPSVLVVDDNPDIVETMVMLLEMWGFEVQSASNGTAALELAVRHRPRIVLLDIGLPDTDGYAVARRLLDLPDMPEMKLVALTGYGQHEDRQRSRAAGFLRHVVKPADPDELLELLEELGASAP